MILFYNLSSKWK